MTQTPLRDLTRIRRTIKGYGWKPQLHDVRDHVFAAPARTRLPARVDLRLSGDLPPVYDQGPLGSCTANALAAAFQYANAKQGHRSYMPSRLFIYYGERSIEHTIRDDAGAELRDGAKVLAKLGAPHESIWPYRISKYAAKPGKRAYTDGLTHQASAYKSLSNATATPTLTALAAGFPVAFGFTAYASLEDYAVDATGILPMPGPQEEIVGGHAVLMCGYDQHTKMVLVRNSWGPRWSAGMKGYFWMPMAYAFSQLASDFWIVEACE